ncbi:MAG: isocitrate/isopropylmalate dehydrogenase family protein [Ignisphaera sp.]|uniref:Isocitrate/isopropylmalate dehydrogenase family protein n=1 Tax=Ignisphaera aggregans TaxID=334771 RepID=A0A7J3MW95_9CREN
MVFNIAVIEGDGIGPEIVSSALKVLEKVVRFYGLQIVVTKVYGGDTAVKMFGEALPEDSWNIIKRSDAILKGPVGESAGDVVVKIRRGLDLYANIRPAKALPGVNSLRRDIDLVIVRENTEDIYVRAEHMVTDDVAIALRVVSKRASERIAKVAFDLALSRRKKITVVHKANVLTVSDGLFRSCIYRVAQNYNDVVVDEMYIDAAVMDIVRRPERFDVIVTTNLFGDILSDLAAYVSGSIGLAASANIGDEKAMFEPIHGAAFDIAGKGLANPMAMIFCVSWMLKWLGEKHSIDTYIKASKSIDRAILEVLKDGTKLTPDLGGNSKTIEFTEAVLEKISY